MFDFLIKDGNFKKWVRTLFVIAGITFVAVGVLLRIKSLFGMFFFFSGFVLAAIGGYAAQANMLKIKPFDNSYENARESYTGCKAKESKED